MSFALTNILTYILKRWKLKKQFIMFSSIIFHEWQNGIQRYTIQYYLLSVKYTIHSTYSIVFVSFYFSLYFHSLSFSFVFFIYFSFRYPFHYPSFCWNSLGIINSVFFKILWSFQMIDPSWKWKVKWKIYMGFTILNTVLFFVLFFVLFLKRDNQHFVRL